MLVVVPSESLIDAYYRKYTACVTELRKKLLRNPENKEIKYKLKLDLEKYNKSKADSQKTNFQFEVESLMTY